jgi:predicted nucleic acid-binding protein
MLREMLKGDIEFALSTAVILEYEDVLNRPGLLGVPPVVTAEQVRIILDALCSRALLVSPWFRFRPFLDDPKDDIFVECALAASAEYIVTDDKHFSHPSIQGFGLRAISAQDFIILQQRDKQP